MAWFKCGGGGIPAALKSLMNAVLNKKWGTSGTYPPETWPETVNLMGPLEEKTVSGSIVAFSDGADAVKLKSCVVTIAPTLAGVSSVGVVSAGKNLFNLVPYLATAYNTPAFADCMFIGAGTYQFSFSELSDASQNVATSWRYCITIYDKTGTLVTDSSPSPLLTYRSTLSSYANGSNSTAKSISLSFANDCYIFVRFWSGDVTADMTAKNCQLEIGVTPSTYEAPEIITHTANLGITIYGSSVDVVNGTGTDENAKTTLDDTGWTYYPVSGHNTFNKVISGALAGGAGFLTGYTWEQVAYIANQSNKCFYFYTSSSGVRISIRDDDYTSLEAWQAHIDGSELVYPKTPEDFTFTPVPILSRLGDNTMWSDDGDLSVIYRSSGTQTIITPTLVTKAITENGTYTAAADNADGFSSVTVEVPAGPSNIETVLGSGVLIEVAGVSGTDVSRTMWTRTAAQDEKVVFHPNTQVKTNTGANDGYFKVLKNDVVVVSTYANTSTTTSFLIPDIDLEAGDVLTISVGFDNYHTSAWFDIWSTITILSSGSAPVLGLGLGNPGAVNEPEEEEPDAAPDEIQEETPEEVDQNESNE